MFDPHSLHTGSQSHILQRCQTLLRLMLCSLLMQVSETVIVMLQPSSALLDSEFPMPHKPRKGVPFFDEEEEEEAYCAAPFNMHAPDVEAPLPSSYAEDSDETTVLPSKFRRGRRFSPRGCLVTFLYLCAFGFYLYVRIAKTLDLGDYVWYGVIVLIVEIAGATTTLVWCLNIIMDPVHEPLRMDPDNPGLTLVRCCQAPSAFHTASTQLASSTA